MSTTQAAKKSGGKAGDVQEATSGTLEIKDSRSGKAYPIPILEPGTEGDTAIRAMDLRQIKVEADEFGLMTYDPAFMNTASCKSAITFIDGDKGILRYRGYPIEQLAEGATFLEVAWLHDPARDDLDVAERREGGRVVQVGAYGSAHRVRKLNRYWLLRLARQMPQICIQLGRGDRLCPQSGF